MAVALFSFRRLLLQLMVAPSAATQWRSNYANVSNYAFRTPQTHTYIRTHRHTQLSTDRQPQKLTKQASANMSSETKSIWFINLPYDKIINYCHAFKLLLPCRRRGPYCLPFACSGYAFAGSFPRLGANVFAFV